MATDYRFAYTRRKKAFCFSALLPLALLFLLIFAASAIQRNLSPELVYEYRDRYPMDVVEIPEVMRTRTDLFPAMEVYENYRADDGTFTAYRLMPEAYSPFSLPGMIRIGTFPGSGHEILITPAAAAELLPEGEWESLIGSTFIFLGVKYTVSGITGDIVNTVLLNYRRMDTAYRYHFREISVFIPYETIKTFGETFQTDSRTLMGVLPGLSEDAGLQRTVKNALGGNVQISWYYNEVEEIRKSADSYSVYLVILLVLLSFVASVFSSSLIRTELYYRRKELGYLQIFGLGQTRIRQMIRREFRAKSTGSLLLAILFYLTAALAVAFIRGRFLLPDLLHTAAILTILLLIREHTVFRTVRKFLKQDVTELIR